MINIGPLSHFEQNMYFELFHSKSCHVFLFFFLKHILKLQNNCIHSCLPYSYFCLGRADISFSLCWCCPAPPHCCNNPERWLGVAFRLTPRAWPNVLLGDDSVWDVQHFRWLSMAYQCVKTSSCKVMNSLPSIRIPIIKLLSYQRSK